MHLATQIGIAFIALEHVYILVLEMFLWTKPLGRKTFGQSKEDAEKTAVLAKNQGLYNGFLAAGLGWSLAMGSVQNAIFFVGCVLVAGVYGGITAKRSILVVQALPALTVLVLLLGLEL